MQVITNIIQFSLVNEGGLLEFSPDDITEFITTQLDRSNPLESNTSTLLLSLAQSLTKIYSNPTRSDITPQISNLLNHTSNSILPQLALPDLETFPPDILQSTLFTAFRNYAISNPELFFEYFGFLGRTIPRYSGTWTWESTQKWMFCTLVSLGNPEGGMAFQGAIDLLVNP
jgi:hypothetical protein